MPFRAKMKRALGRSSSPSSTSSPKERKPKKEKLADNVYKPGEPMPRPKYRGPYNKAHQDKLSAFSFAQGFLSDVGRRKSGGASEYSPMGSRLPSRGPSRGPSRDGSVWSAWSEKSRGVKSRRGSAWGGGGAGGNGLGVEENGDEDDDVGNVGLSRPHTAERRRPPGAADEVEVNSLKMSRTVTNMNGYTNEGMEGLEEQQTITNGRLFTEDELANAMTQSTLKPSKRDKE